MAVNSIPTFLLILLTIIYIICFISSVFLDKNKVNINKNYCILKRTISLILMVITIFIDFIVLAVFRDELKIIYITNLILLILFIVPSYILIFTNKKAKN